MVETGPDDSNKPTGHLPGGMGRVRRAGLGFVVLWFLLGGIARFVATDAEMRIVPPYVPSPRLAVLLSGMFELLGAAGLLWQPTRRAAGLGLFALTILVTPVHIYMLQQPALFGVPYWALIVRLPLQAALLALILWISASARPRPASMTPSGASSH